jgi:hypothetical protein
MESVACEEGMPQDCKQDLGGRGSLIICLKIFSPKTIATQKKHKKARLRVFRFNTVSIKTNSAKKYGT